MKLLFLTSTLPLPADQGGKLRNLHFLRSLASAAEVYLVSFDRERADADSKALLRSMCREVHYFENRRGPFRKLLDVVKSLVSGVPYLVLANRSDAIEKSISALITEKKIDAIQVAELWMAGNIPSGNPHPPIVLDAHNVEAQVQRAIAGLSRNPLHRFFYSFQAKLTSRFEAEVAASADTVFCVSPGDMRYFEPLARKPVLVPNAISLPSLATAERDKTILFTGTLQYPPNLDGLEWFLSDVWPAIAARLPEARFDVIARNVPARLKDAGHQRVRFLEDVDRIEPHLERARLMVVPLRAGGGTRFKILQAFAHGLPVVSTPVGADGIAARHEEHLLLAEDAATFSRSVETLYRSAPARQALAGAARELAETTYSWERIFPVCEAAYAEILT